MTSESEEEEEEEEAPKGVPLQANGPAAPQQKASDALLLLLLHTNAPISKQVARAPMTYCTLLNGYLHLLVLLLSKCTLSETGNQSMFRIYGTEEWKNWQ